MSFDRHQLKKLATPLDETRIQRREQDGKTLGYLEGWFVIQEANRIFGYDGWDRQMIQSERVFLAKDTRGVSCGYMARVRVRVRTQTGTVVREGTGFGQAVASQPGDAHERALKAAETDATKRALVTFGGRFGLLLHDKDRSAHQIMPAVASESSLSAPGSRTGAPRSASDSSAADRPFLCLVQADGVPFQVASAESFCTGLRQLIEAAVSGQEVARLQHHNAAGLMRLRGLAHLTTARGAHYADVLEGLIAAKIKAFGAAESGNPQTDVPHTDGPATEGLATNGSESDKSGTHKIAAEAIADISAQPVQDPAANAMPSPKIEHSYVPVPAYPLARVMERMGAPSGDSASSQAAVPKDAQHDKSRRLANPPPGVLEVAGPSKADSVPAGPTRRSQISGGFSIDKSVLAIASDRRLRSKAHLVWVASRPCLVCEALPCHAHHITFAQPRGLSQKVSDEYTVPLCAPHHNELHVFGNEASWWRNQGIEPLAKANALWLESVGLQTSPALPKGAAATAEDEAS